MDSQANQALIELKLIDQLIIKRKLLIDTFCQAVELQVKAMKIADEINQDIPTVNSGYIDDFSSIFIQLASALGESSRGRSLPRNGNLVRLSEKELKALVIKTVDSSLWVWSLIVSAFLAVCLSYKLLNLQSNVRTTRFPLTASISKEPCVIYLIIKSQCY